MNRSRFVRRLIRTEDGDLARIAEGTDRAQAFALSIAANHSEEFVEYLARHLAALDEFGGSVFIAANRVRLYGNEVVEHNEPGQYHTAGYVFDFTEKPRLRTEVDEPDVPLSQAEPDPLDPEPVLGPDPETNGLAPVPEPVES